MRKTQKPKKYNPRTLIPAREIENAYNRAKRDASHHAQVLFLAALHDSEGYGHIRLNRVYAKIIKYADEICEGRIKINELESMLTQECGVNLWIGCEKMDANRPKRIKTELYNDNFQNYKRYNIPKAQLVIADIPYNVGTNFYGSNPMWYNGGDNKNGESKLAGKAAFNSDFNFNIAEYFHFCNRLLKPEPKKSNGRGKSSDAPCMIVFCSFEQMQTVIKYAEKHGFKKNIPLVFVKNYSPQVLKANMRICGATEYALVLYRDKLPKFRNDGHMVFNWFEWKRDSAKEIPKIHPAQKPVSVLKRLIEIFTDPGDIVIDPCAGSGSTLRAAQELGRSSYGFEISKEFYRKAMSDMLRPKEELTMADYIAE